MKKHHLPTYHNSRKTRRGEACRSLQWLCYGKSGSAVLDTKKINADFLCLKSSLTLLRFGCTRDSPTSIRRGIQGQRRKKSTVVFWPIPKGTRGPGHRQTAFLQVKAKWSSKDRSFTLFNGPLPTPKTRGLLNPAGKGALQMLSLTSGLPHMLEGKD